MVPYPTQTPHPTPGAPGQMRRMCPVRGTEHHHKLVSTHFFIRSRPGEWSISLACLTKIVLDFGAGILYIIARLRREWSVVLRSKL